MKYKFLKKIQKLPIEKRKMIVWAVVVALGIMLFIWWLINTIQTLESFKG